MSPKELTKHMVEGQFSTIDSYSSNEEESCCFRAQTFIIVITKAYHWILILSQFSMVHTRSIIYLHRNS